MLNGRFANRAMEADRGTRLEQFNYAWIDDLLAVQRGETDWAPAGARLGRRVGAP